MQRDPQKPGEPRDAMQPCRTQRVRASPGHALVQGRTSRNQGQWQRASLPHVCCSACSNVMFSDARDGALASSALCAGQLRHRMQLAAGTRRKR
jgi:hypothetical protein